MTDHDDPPNQGKHPSLGSLEQKDSFVSLSTHSEESIRYGDSIYLVVSNTESKSLKLVSSFISSPDHCIVTLDNHSYGSTPNPMPDIHMAVFRVLTPNKSQAQDELIKFKEKKLGPTKKLKPNEEKRLSQLKRYAENEINENVSEQKRLTGKEIEYGNTFQLQHDYTGKYLGVSDRQTAVVDRASLKVTLFDTDGEHVQFKITPKYKVSHIGEKIRIEDQIVLENVKAKQFLHFSEHQIKALFYGIQQNSQEINASSSDSVFSIYSHIKLQNIGPQSFKNIRGGSVLRLYHLQAQCYVVAAGCCVFDGDGIVNRVVTDDVHLRTRKIKFGNLKPPSTSAITYWEVELVRAPLSGDELKYEEPYRLKHLLTQRYLSVTKVASDKFDIKLIKQEDDKTGDDSSFVFRPFIDEGNEKIGFGSCARIYHKATNTWIKASDDCYESNNVPTGRLELSGFKWDNATCFKVMVQPDKGYHEAFTLEEVDSHLLDYFHHTMGYLPIIWNYLISYDVEITTNNAMESSMQSLVEWLLDASDEKDKKKRQKLLRNLGIIELLMEIQNRFTQIPNKSREGQNYQRRINTTKMIYKVTEAYLQGNSRKNENYACKFIPTLESHFDLKIHAGATLVELIRDNKPIISTFSVKFQEFTEDLIQKLAATKNHRIFYYFGVMCVANKNPIRENQVILARQLKELQAHNTIFLMKLDDPNSPNPKILATSPIEPWEEKFLSEYVSANDEINEDFFKYILAQLDFFSKICCGNNVKAIETLEKLFPFEVLFAGLKDELIHPLVRAKFTQLINVMFIDVGANRAVLENLTLTFVYSECTKNLNEKEERNSEIAYGGAKNKYFPGMREWFLDFFAQVNLYQQREFNQLTEAVLGTLLLFVQFGYFNDHHDADKIQNLLIQILTSENKERNSNEEEKINASIVNIKIECLLIFNLFINFQFFHRLNQLIFLYRVIRNEDGIRGRRSTIRKEPPENVLSSHLQYLHDKKFNDNGHAYKAVKELTETILKSAMYEFERLEGENSFGSILLGLAQNENLELVNTALRLLNNQYRVELYLFWKAVQTKILINDTSIQFFKETNKELPKFRRRLKGSYNEGENCDYLIEKLTFFIENCKLPDNNSFAHPQNQKILYNFGILADVINLLERIKDNRAAFVSSSQMDTTRKDGPTKLAESACMLLQIMAKDNITVQERLYNRLEILVDQSLFDIVPYHLANLLAEIFTGAQKIVMNVKARDIKLICSLMKSKDNHRLENIAPILEAMAKVEEIDLPIHFNQIHIMNNLMPMIPEKILGTEKENCGMREKLLNSEMLEEPDVLGLESMLAIYNLLGSLSEGNLHHQSICQSMITREELLKILNNKKIPLERKYQFASFFNWVYLNTSIQSSAFETSVGDDPEFWKFLENITDVLSEIDCLSKTSLGQEKDLRTHEQNGSLFKSELPTPHIDSLGPGLSNYLMKGVLPIITVFYLRYFSIKNMEEEVVKKYDPLRISTKICNMLVRLSIQLQPYLTNKYHGKLLHNAAASILTHPEIRSLSDKKIASIVDHKLLSAFLKLVDEEDQFVAKPLMDYQAQYQEEIELNNEFDIYIKRLKRVYEGENTVNSQIPQIKYSSANEHPYSKYLDDRGKFPSPDYIPLGPSFQRHLGLFFQHTKEGCEVEKEFAKSIIRRLKYSSETFNELTERDKLKREQLDIKSFQLLRGAIHNEILHIDPTLKEKNPIQFRNELKKVEKVQSTIQDLNNTCIMALQLIDHPSKAVASQSIALLADMLYGGNVYIQKQLETLAETRQDKFFKKMRDIVFYGGNRSIASRALTDQVNERDKIVRGIRKHLENLQIKISKLPVESEIFRNKSFGHFETKTETDKALLVETQKKGIEMKPLKEQSASLKKEDALWNERPQEKTPIQDVQSKRLDILLEQIDKRPPKSKDLKNPSVSDSHEEAYGRKLRNIQVSFKLMGRMCDGQQKFLQDFFREQTHSTENINMVVKTVNFLRTFHIDINADNIHIITEAFQTLTEFVSGNFENQTDAYNAKIMDVVNRIFQTVKFKYCTIEAIVKLYDSIIRMLQVMTEETTLSTKDLAKDILGILDIPNVHQIIALLYDVGKRKKDFKELCELAEDDMFRLYHFLIHFKDFEGISELEESSKIIPADEHELEAWNYCSRNSKSVEVIYITEDNVEIINKVHFKSLEKGKLTEDLSEKVKWEVKRDSPGEKIRNFVEWFATVKRDQNYSNTLKTNSVIKFYLMHQTWRKHLFLLWSLIVNLFLLSTWVTPCDHVSTVTINDTLIYQCENQVPNSSAIPPILPIVPTWYFFAFFPLGITHLLLALDLLVLFYIVNGINFYIPGIFHQIISFCQKIFPKKYFVKGTKKETEDYSSREKKPPKKNYLRINIFGSKVAFIWMIFLSSLLSLPFRGYFYPISLLYILERSDILRRVLKSVTKNGKSLIFVAIFGVILLYIFGVIGFALFYQQAQSSVNPESERYIFCRSLYECVISIGRWGLLETIGLIIPQRSLDFSSELIRIIYDLFFFIIISTIGLNIVFGIIVDTFSELRDEKYAQESDMKSVCFICGIENYQFDRKGNGFKNHVKYEHNMWDYYSFFIYLDNVYPSEHTATESFVFQNLEKDEIVFFPQNRARCLKQEDDDTAMELSTLTRKVEDLTSLVKESLAKKNAS